MKRSIVQTLSASLFAWVFTVITIAAIGPSIARAPSDEIPTLDVQPVCRGVLEIIGAPYGNRTRVSAVKGL